MAAGSTLDFAFQMAGLMASNVDLVSLFVLVPKELRNHLKSFITSFKDGFSSTAATLLF
jgi:hypothetical protein